MLTPIIRTMIILNKPLVQMNQSVLYQIKLLRRRLWREPAQGLIHITSWGRNSPQNALVQKTSNLRDSIVLKIHPIYSNY